MKKIAFLIFIGLMILYVGNKTTEALMANDLDKMAHMVREMDPQANITEWTILAREKTESPAYKVAASLQKRFPEYAWHTEKENGEQAWTGKAMNKKLNVILTIKVTSWKSETFLLVRIEGQDWSDQHADYIRTYVKTGIKGVFHNKPQFFSCMKGITGDTMDRVLVKNWMKTFSAKPLETAIEEDFISIASNSKQFSNTMTNDVNFQLAFRKDGMGGGTRFTIGTPIIAFEY